MNETSVAVLLAAGAGSRLQPLTSYRPKALLQVGDETILGRAVRILACAGIRELVVVTGYRSEMIHEALSNCPIRVRYCHNEAFDRTQNAVSLHLCAGAVSDRSFFKVDGDLLFRSEALQRLSRSEAPLAVAVDASKRLGAEEMKVAAEGDRITAFGKQLDPDTCAGESIGLERIDACAAPELFRALGRAVEMGRAHLYYEDVYGELVAGGLDARRVDVTDLPWVEVDSPADLEDARRLWAEGRLGEGTIPR
jgi:choline kinase